MKLKDQVCSLESAKKLKRLGVKQDSMWYWVRLKRGEYVVTEVIIDKAGNTGLSPKEKLIASAFTVAELINMLQSVKEFDIIIPASIENVAEYLAGEIMNEKTSAKKN